MFGGEPERLGHPLFQERWSNRRAFKIGLMAGQGMTAPAIARALGDGVPPNLITAMLSEWGHKLEGETHTYGIVKVPMAAKHRTLHSIEAMNRGTDLPDLIRQIQEKWDAKSVRMALADAFRVLHAVESRPGHKRIKAAWPEYMLEPIDIAEQRLAGNIQQGRMKAVIKPNAIQISRMETVLLGRDGMPPWLNGAVKAYPEHRRILIVAVKAQAARHSGRTVAGWLHMPESSFRASRDFAAAQIAKQLNRAGVEPW
eukprot:jgi/Tetstr1/450625/TSEL_037661.t1